MKANAVYATAALTVESQSDNDKHIPLQSCYIIHILPLPLAFVMAEQNKSTKIIFTLTGNHLVVHIFIRKNDELDVAKFRN